jgi:hypothetical protein
MDVAIMVIYATMAHGPIGGVSCLTQKTVLFGVRRPVAACEKVERWQRLDDVTVDPIKRAALVLGAK